MEFLQSVKWILELGVEKKCGCEFTFTLLAGVCIANTRFQVKCTWRTGQALRAVRASSASPACCSVWRCLLFTEYVYSTLNLGIKIKPQNYPNTCTQWFQRVTSVNFKRFLLK